MKGWGIIKNRKDTMKKNLLTLLIGLSIISCSTKQKDESNAGIIFQEDIEFSNALEQSKKEGKLLFIDCYTVWCGPCKMLTAEIFPNKELGNLYNDKFICLKYDLEKPEGVKLKDKYNIQGYPTLLFLDSAGDVIQKRVGGGEVKDFIDLATLALDSTKSIKNIVAKIANGDRSYEVISTYLEADYYAVNADTLLNDYYQTINLNDSLSKESLELFMNFDRNINSVMFKHALKNRAQFEQKIGSSEFKRKMISAFYSFIDRNKDNPSIKDTLKFIDIETYTFVQLNEQYLNAYQEFRGDSINKIKWDAFITSAAKHLMQSGVHPMALNASAWEVWLNYKTFNDSTALKTALNWAKSSHEKLPTDPEVADTYGHILFDLGYFKEAVEMAELSATEGERTGSKDLHYYKENVINYKKSL